MEVIGIKRVILTSGKLSLSTTCYTLKLALGSRRIPPLLPECLYRIVTGHSVHTVPGRPGSGPCSKAIQIYLHVSWTPPILFDSSR